MLLKCFVSGDEVLIDEIEFGNEGNFQILDNMLDSFSEIVEVSLDPLLLIFNLFLKEHYGLFFLTQ
jgi:hypothetical protein